MTTSTMFILVGSVLLNSFAQLFLKQGSKVLDGNHVYGISNLFALITNLSILLGLFCYGISILMWIYILSKLEVSRAYPMLSLGFIFNVFTAWVFFGEVISLEKIFGVCLIIAGVWVLSQL